MNKYQKAALKETGLMILAISILVLIPLAIGSLCLHLFGPDGIIVSAVVLLAGVTYFIYKMSLYEAMEKSVPKRVKKKRKN